jgi:hypothetical protein
MINAALITQNKKWQTALTLIGLAAGVIAIWNFIESRKTRHLEKRLKEMEFDLKKHQLDTIKKNGN